VEGGRTVKASGFRSTSFFKILHFDAQSFA